MWKSCLKRFALAAGVAVVCSCAAMSNNSRPISYAVGTGPADQLQLPAPFDTPSAQKSIESDRLGPKAERLSQRRASRSAYSPTSSINPRQSLCAAEQRTSSWWKSIREWPEPRRSAGKVGQSHHAVPRHRQRRQDPTCVETFLTGLNMPEGMLLLGNWFYVGNTDGVVRLSLSRRTDENRRRRRKDSRSAGRRPSHAHSDRRSDRQENLRRHRLRVQRRRRKYLGERSQRRAGIVEMNPDGTAMRIFANGLRNPVGMDWEPKTKTLWTVVNERDLLGDDLVPDYLTSVKDGAFYGWPYSYFGQNEDPRKKANGPIWSPKRSSPTTRWARTPPPRLGFLQRQSVYPNAIRAALLSACTAHGTARKWLATKSRSCRSPTANPPDRSKTSSPASSPTKASSEAYGRPVGVTVAARWLRCSSPDDSGGKVRVSAENQQATKK